MKFVESFFGLLVLGIGAGVTLGMRMNAAEAILPNWYLTFGDQLLIALGAASLFVLRDSSPMRLVMAIGQLIVSYFLPVVAFIVLPAMDFSESSLLGRQEFSHAVGGCMLLLAASIFVGAIVDCKKTIKEHHQRS